MSGQNDPSSTTTNPETMTVGNNSSIDACTTAASGRCLVTQPNSEAPLEENAHLGEYISLMG